MSAGDLNLLDAVKNISLQPSSPIIVFVTHHVEEILPMFGQTLLLKKGRVFAAGETEKVLTAETLGEFYEIPVNLQKSADRFWLSMAI